MAYTTVPTVKAYLNITETTDDALLTQLITYAQQIIDTYTQRTFESSADATRKFTVGKDTDGLMLYLDEDLASITTVKTDADAASPVTLTTSEYITHPRNRTPYHALEILRSSSNDWTYTTNPENGIEITGKWAYSTSAPNDIAQACLRLTAWLYRQKDAQVFETTAIPEAGVITIPQGFPRDVERFLTPYVKRASWQLV